MKTIREILDALPTQERAKLQYAFEHDLAQYVVLSGDRFVGVNCKQVPILAIETEAGLWSTGSIKGEYK